MCCAFIIWISYSYYSFDNDSSRASCVTRRCKMASKSSVGWVCRRLLRLHVYHHLFCVIHPFRSLHPIRAKLWHFATPSSYICFMKSSGKPLNFIVIGRWRTWRLSNSMCCKEGLYVVYDASCSNLILSPRTLRKLLVGSSKDPVATTNHISFILLAQKPIVMVKSLVNPITIHKNHLPVNHAPSHATLRAFISLTGRNSLHRCNSTWQQRVTHVWLGRDIVLPITLLLEILMFAWRNCPNKLRLELTRHLANAYKATRSDLGASILRTICPSPCQWT